MNLLIVYKLWEFKGNLEEIFIKKKLIILELIIKDEENMKNIYK